MDGPSAHRVCLPPKAPGIRRQPFATSTLRGTAIQTGRTARAAASSPKFSAESLGTTGVDPISWTFSGLAGIADAGPSLARGGRTRGTLDDVRGGSCRRASSGRWRSASVPSHRQVVNPVRPGREQRQRRTRVPGCGWCGPPPFDPGPAGAKRLGPARRCSCGRAATRYGPRRTPPRAGNCGGTSLRSGGTHRGPRTCPIPRIHDGMRMIPCIVGAARTQERRACGTRSSVSPGTR